MKNSKNVFKLKPEDKLILSCGHSQVNDELEKKIIELVNLDLDWEYIVDMATRHRLRPLLYYNLNKICPDKVPEDVLVILREFYHSNVRKNLMMTGELVKVMKLLEDDCINAVTYKGPVLAQMVYGNVGYREFGDLDILVDKSDALKAKEIILRTEYELISKKEVDDSIFMEMESEFQFVNSKTGSIIEINWNFNGNFLSLSEKFNFFNEVEKRDLSNFKVYNPIINNQLLMLCLHAAKHDWTRLAWLCDISEYINKNYIEWDELLEKADLLNVKKILVVNLILAKELFELNIPLTFNHLLNDSSSMKISNYIKNIIFMKKPLNIFEKFYLDLNKRDSLKYGIKDCLAGLTKPTSCDYSDLPLPEKFFTFYLLIRPLLLLRRYGKNSI